MSSTGSRYTSIPFIVGIYVACYVGMSLIPLAIAAFHSKSKRELMVGLFPGSALPAGQWTAWYWRNRESAVPANGRAWTYALICGVVSTALLFVLVAAGLLSDDDCWEFYLPFVLLVNIFCAGFGFWTIFGIPPYFWKDRWKIRKPR